MKRWGYPFYGAGLTLLAAGYTKLQAAVTYFSTRHLVPGPRLWFWLLFPLVFGALTVLLREIPSTLSAKRQAAVNGLLCLFNLLLCWWLAYGHWVFYSVYNLVLAGVFAVWFVRCLLQGRKPPRHLPFEE